MSKEDNPKQKDKKKKEIKVNVVYKDGGKTFQELMEELLKSIAKQPH
ncbi:MAG: hypothetical protein A4E52_02169 [Pelotomaculum sp. PtaB.Bin013]|uniref:Uncharacterized protein n=1 Tax=Pelotomaculum isophthalicicum JI TaxID=947010 RepID=A0A9X4H2Y9_9FIRM|nr:hypothetical protein [Pelotomaculum isophthalicicum]MDF9408731.1 hypothetical protein [Pelotomaculum isophthalicicum JI]OPX81670.1 MAG: hypothetical protein A4E52_02169 [Pelotomaculum sp. PtaB.Bin013]